MPFSRYGVDFADPEAGKDPSSSIELQMCFIPQCATASGFLGRYQHLHNAIDLIWNVPRRKAYEQRGIKGYDERKHDAFIWNDWSELMVETFCEWHWGTTVFGPNACVSGETRIWNPLTGESPTIKQLHESHTAPVVMTLDGPEQAEVPWIKGFADLYEVELSDGSKFTATSEHRVLTPSGAYVRVGSLSIGSRLLGYEHDLPASNSGTYQLVHALDARDFPKIIEGFQADCLQAPHFDDEQLLVEAIGDRLSFPLRDDVPKRTPIYWRQDDRSVVSHNLCASQCDRLSSARSVQGEHRYANPTLFHVPSNTIGRAYDYTLSPSRSPLLEGRHEPFVKRVPHSSQPHLNASCAYKIRMCDVVSIIRAEKDIYYDITVPRAAHYFAEGAIHHNSSKTTTAALYVLSAWFSSPHETAVVLTTTSLPGLRKRIWKEILKYYRMGNPGLGHVNASDFAIRFEKGSDESGIFGIATGQDEGDIQKAVDKIIGFHAKNVFVVVDEMQATNEAIVKACLSLEAGADRFQFIGLGNPDSELDSLGQMSEPIGGYDSITPETGRWETKQGVCIHLDGLDSPRVKEGDEFYPGLLNQRDIDSAIRQYGEDSPDFWRTRRGFIAPQGVTKTVLSVAMIRKGNAREKAQWASTPVLGAGLDPAFEGGDRCILRFAKCGELVAPEIQLDEDTFAPIKPKKGPVGIELGEIVQIKVSATNPEPIHYQIVHAVKEECEKRGVAPEMFALDSTGEGGGLAAIFQKEWSPMITLVEFGGRASDLPVSEHNKKPAYEEYFNRVTELWYTFRTMVFNGLIRGLDNATAIEFCSRLYKERGSAKQVEKKADMKERTRKSPDLADAAVIVVELFRQVEHIGGTGSGEQTDDAWERFRRQHETSEESMYLIEA